MMKVNKILYVDDEEINLKLFKLIFGKKYNVLTAENAFEALNILKSDSDILIIISDMRMPKMNGLEFIKIAQKKFPKKKYYILTGFEITKEIKDALESGLIIKYFRKPFNKIELESAIIEIIGIETKE